ncbi:hypothetical protein LTR60_000530, partial [Cryomyces antarcticus]
GLSTSFRSLKANLVPSLAVAITGISAPVALSFILQGLVGATPLQAFAAGAALCSTSLGTTFTVLGTSGLTTTRLGVVLTSAAMMDDVVGLVMVQVISNLGGGGSSFSAITVVRPIAVSLGLAIITPLVCRYLAKPLTLWLNGRRESNVNGLLHKSLHRRASALLVHTAILLGLVTGATYAGTSSFFAAYLAGASISWWDSEVAHFSVKMVDTKAGNQNTPVPGPLQPPEQASLQSDATEGAIQTAVENTCVNASGLRESEPPVGIKGKPSSLEKPSRTAFTGELIYLKYYHPAVQRVLKPFFFASIGFSVPISQMFTGSIVWRGIIYTILMVLGKLVCGLWLVRFDVPSSISIKLPKVSLPLTPHFWGMQKSPKAKSAKSSPQQEKMAAPSSAGISTEATPATEESPASMGPDAGGQSTEASASPEKSTRLRKPRSLYPAAILGSAMVARGEVGFLISSTAQSKGVLGSEVFLVATWAIVLCTILGPISVGLLVGRVKRLQKKAADMGGRDDALGIWGVS